ncbi:MAG: phosphodiester glycosidase family protein, partial [Abitibacteriaceae bacterium]|nr:phosphodiester glycosidase family protein [Abditibacteriaceae bacterium]
MQFIKCYFARRVLLLALLAGPNAARLAHADFPGPQPYSPMRYEHRTSVNPAQQIFVARIDLSDPAVDIRVAPGSADPDGPGEYQTTLQTPTTIAEREHLELAVNGDFFTARNTVDTEGAKSGFVPDKWAKVIGPAVTDGYLWAAAAEPRAALVLDAQKHPSIMMTKDAPANAYQVIAGSDVIVRDGQVSITGSSSFVRSRHPRTAVGIEPDGKTLVLVVVDGRQPGVAVGMSLPELADLMKQLGCRDALNLDGGGSTEMVLRNPENGQLQVLNHPSDGRERAVANVLGITIRGSRRTPKLPPPVPVAVKPTDVKAADAKPTEAKPT